MGLFTPKISDREMEYVRSRMSQLQDSVKLINSTVKPDVFFKRLNMALDILMDLRAYERYGIFKGRGPSSDYQDIVNRMGAIVDDFIDRAVAENNKKIASLKTERAKQNAQDKFVVSLIAAFDCANTFWSGSFSQTRSYPHYTGPLFTENNYHRVQALFYEDDAPIKNCDKHKTATSAPTTFCGKCGYQLSGTANFCGRCGTRVNDPRNRRGG